MKGIMWKKMDKKGQENLQRKLLNNRLVMFERLDLESRECSNCHGSGKDPKKRTRKCPICYGSGKELYCSTCGNKMPCPGTRDLLDQGNCISDEERKEINLRCVTKE